MGKRDVAISPSGGVMSLERAVLVWNDLCLWMVVKALEAINWESDRHDVNRRIFMIDWKGRRRILYCIGVDWYVMW